MGLSIVQKKRVGDSRADGCPAGVKEDVPCVDGCAHAEFAG